MEISTDTANAVIYAIFTAAAVCFVYGAILVFMAGCEKDDEM